MTDFVGRNIRSPRQLMEYIEDGANIHGLTYGDWSFSDSLVAIANRIGYCDVVISTWTVGSADLRKQETHLRTAKFRSLRMLVDRSFERRQPKYCATLRQAFGDDAIRVWDNHAKFAVLTGGEFDVLYETSANLNKNRRMESFTVFCGGDIPREYLEMVNEFYEIQTPGAIWGRENNVNARYDTEKLMTKRS